MLLQFFLPYLTLCHLAAWGIAQNLEGLGLFSYLNSEPIQVGTAIVYPLNLNPARGVASVSVLLTAVLFVVFLLNVRACFYLNKWIGSVGILLWLVPGLLSLLGFVPDTRGIGPDVFRFGQGFPGTMESAAANLFFCLMGGWSLILLISSRWAKNTFKNAYDHIWYALGLIAALYFVVDAGLPSYRSDLAHADQRTVRTLKLFDVAAQRLEILCTVRDAAAISPALCASAPELRRRVLSYLDMTSAVRAKIEPPNWVATLATNPELAHQIDALNRWACQKGNEPRECEKIPQDSALSVADTDSPIAFPPPSYAKAIQQFHASMERSARRIDDIERGHNLRYFGFLVVAILAGGKLANASRALVKADSVRPPSWIGIVCKFVVKTATAFLKLLSKLCGNVYRYHLDRVGQLLLRHQEVRATRLGHRNERTSEEELP